MEHSDQDVRLPLIESNLTCYGFHVWAEDFLRAARASSPLARQGSFVEHFLCCQSIELSLKAFLSLKGMSREELRRKPYGHNLSELLQKARSKGLEDFVELADADTGTIETATKWYDTSGGKRFQYFDVGNALRAFSGAPEYSALDDLANRLQSPSLREATLHV